ncbi:hypothetical protein GG344DRAFT_71118 [Lentinula edodes]|nr:hypothetical protein GG344DRAFT_71118 [Lentinula edodes]
MARDNSEVRSRVLEWDVGEAISNTLHTLLVSLMSSLDGVPVIRESRIARKQRLLIQSPAGPVQLLESQLADLQRENSSLTTALCDTLHALEARALQGPPGQSASKKVEELRVANKEWDAAVEQLSTSSRKVSELTTTLLHVRPGSEKVLSVLGAGWSSKGATETATEDRNNLVVAGTKKW